MRMPPCPSDVSSQPGLAYALFDMLASSGPTNEGTCFLADSNMARTFSSGTSGWILWQEKTNLRLLHGVDQLLDHVPDFPDASTRKDPLFSVPPQNASAPVSPLELRRVHPGAWAGRFRLHPISIRSSMMLATEPQE